MELARHLILAEQELRPFEPAHEAGLGQIGAALRDRWRPGKAGDQYHRR